MSTRASCTEFGQIAMSTLSSDGWPSFDVTQHPVPNNPPQRCCDGQARTSCAQESSEVYGDRARRRFLTLAMEALPGTPLLAPIMRSGCLVAPTPTLATIREHVRTELAKLPERLRSLDDGDPYPVEITPALRDLAAEIDAHTYCRARELGRTRPGVGTPSRD